MSYQLPEDDIGDANARAEESSVALESLQEVAQELRNRVQQMQDTAGERSPIGKIKEAAKEIEKAATEVAGSRKSSSRRVVANVQIKKTRLSSQ